MTTVLFVLTIVLGFAAYVAYIIKTGHQLPQRVVITSLIGSATGIAAAFAAEAPHLPNSSDCLFMAIIIGVAFGWTTYADRGKFVASAAPPNAGFSQASHVTPKPQSTNTAIPNPGMWTPPKQNGKLHPPIPPMPQTDYIPPYKSTPKPDRTELSLLEKIGCLAFGVCIHFALVFAGYACFWSYESDLQDWITLAESPLIYWTCALVIFLIALAAEIIIFRIAIGLVLRLYGVKKITWFGGFVGTVVGNTVQLNQASNDNYSVQAWRSLRDSYFAICLVMAVWAANINGYLNPPQIPSWENIIGVVWSGFSWPTWFPDYYRDHVLISLPNER
jgi:hypothetical protein